MTDMSDRTPISIAHLNALIGEEEKDAKALTADNHTAVPRDHQEADHTPDEQDGPENKQKRGLSLRARILLATAATAMGLIAAEKTNPDVSKVLRNTPLLGQDGTLPWEPGPYVSSISQHFPPILEFHYLEHKNTQGEERTYRSDIDPAVLSTRELVDPASEGLRTAAQLNAVIIRETETAPDGVLTNHQMAEIIQDAISHRRAYEGRYEPGVIDLKVATTNMGVQGIDEVVIEPTYQEVITDETNGFMTIDYRDQRWDKEPRAGLLDRAVRLADSYFGTKKVRDYLKSLGDFSKNNYMLISFRNMVFIARKNDSSTVTRVRLEENPKYEGVNIYPRMVDDEYLAFFDEIDLFNESDLNLLTADSY